MEEFVLNSGTLLAGGRYIIKAHLASGGFGKVYAALDTQRGERVAVKEMFWHEHCKRDEYGAVCLINEKDAKEYKSIQAAFRREADTLMRLAHIPGIVHGRETFEENGTAYIVMDALTGATLAKRNAEVRSQKKPGASRVIRQFLPLMESLAQVHAAGFIHRDVSPENIIVSPKGGFTLIDFGSAGVYERKEGERFTTIAKDGFAPAEQYRELDRQGPFSDVYGLCATIYTCLTGTVPESAKARRLMDDQKTPSQMGVKISREMEAVLMRGLAVNASARYEDMYALSRAIKKALKAEQIRAAGMAVLGALLAAAIGFGGWYAAMFFQDDASAPGNEIQVSWENPVLMNTAGKNQVRAAKLEGETNVYLYRFSSLEGGTQGERDDLLRILRQRLDALGTPYAFSEDTGEASYVAVRMPKERLSNFVVATLADNYLYVTGERVDENISLSYNRYNGTSGLTVETKEDGSYALHCSIGGSFSYDNLTEGMQRRGEETLYLRDRYGNALASAPLDAVEDGVITFTTLRFEGAEAMNADTRFIADYIDVLVNQPPLPFAGSLENREALDVDGVVKENAAVEGGMNLPRTAGDQALIDVLRVISRDTDYPCFENPDGTLFIRVNLPVDDDLPENVATVTERLLGGYPLSEQVYNHSVIIQLIDEAEDERLRVALGRRIALDDTPGEENDISGFLIASERLAPYQEAINAWWQSMPEVYHGFSVEK